MISRDVCLADLEPLTARAPTLTLDPDRPHAYLPNFTLRGPAELWLTW